MVLLGILVTFFGFLISFMSLSITANVNGRLVMVLIGLAVSFIGIIGLINRAFLRNANWRR
jgi:hypothetical protein